MIQNPFFPEIHGNFGFGCMRLPMKDGHVDYDEFCRMRLSCNPLGNLLGVAAPGKIGDQCSHRNLLPSHTDLAMLRIEF